jgi:single-stranded-DNA-specific exonuclease
MVLKYGKWEVLNEPKNRNLGLNANGVVKVLLKNRGLTTKRKIADFLRPSNPQKLTLKSLGISAKEVTRTIKRLKIAKKNREKVIIYGDYDADGISATAILWESLYSLGIDVSPYIPERFSEGYGLNTKSIEKLKTENSKLKVIITVDNGIVANKAVDFANKAGVDVIIVDHHQKGKKLPKAYSILQTDKICGSAIAWILSREVIKVIKVSSSKDKVNIRESLELAAIGTVADQMPLIGSNRSFVKYGIRQLHLTERVGLLALLQTAGIKRDDIGMYEINYVIAPRLNAMGRLVHAIDSLRLLCTKDPTRARNLAKLLNETNQERQRIVDKVFLHARESIGKRGFESVIVLAHKSYHEGVIGLAAGKLVDEYYRPSVVFAKGDVFSKASARSIPGFNLIEVIRKLEDLIEEGGGHPMAAGFTIKTEKIREFKNRFEETSRNYLSDEILSKRLKIDCRVDFVQLSFNLLKKILEFEPTGTGNPMPLFLTEQVKVVDARVVGQTDKHLKLMLEKGGKAFSAIAFNFGTYSDSLLPGKIIDAVYSMNKNVWNGHESIELNIKDLRVNG